MKQGFTILALAVACLFLSQNLRADILKGRVVDADTGEPLSGAEIVLPFNVLFFIFAANYK